MQILIASGVNLDLLGQREPDVYGHATLADMEKLLASEWPALAKKYGFTKDKLHFFQSNSESELLEKISAPWRGVVLNAGAWTHTSLALADRLAALQTKFVEVHVSQLSQREDFRQHSYTAKHALGVVYGFGVSSYLLGLDGLLSKLASSHDQLTPQPRPSRR